MEKVESDLIAELLQFGRIGSWSEIAERHGIANGNIARKRWAAWAVLNGYKTEIGTSPPIKIENLPRFDLSKMELRRVVTDADDNPQTKYYGQKVDYFKDLKPNDPNIEIIGGTHHVGGNQQWVRWKEVKPTIEELTTEQRKEFETRRTELETAKGEHSYQNAAQTGKTENWVIVGCAHFPGHNKRIWNGLLRYISEHKIDGFVFAGDALDLRSLSAHETGKVRDITLWNEYESCLEPFKELHSALPNTCKKVFLYGNHEDRYLRTLKDNENSRFGDALLSPERAMKLPENRWNVLRNWKEDNVLITPELEVFHGNKLGDNPAQKELKDCILSNCSAIFFHTHRFGIASNGKIAAYNCGLLGDIDHEIFKYESRRTRQQWQNGFCLVSVLDDGTPFVNPVRCSVNGFALDGIFYGG